MRVGRSLTVAVSVAALSGCGGSSSPRQPPARLEHIPGSATPAVVLTPLGAQRIGIETAPVAPASGGKGHRLLGAVPYSAVLYLLNGTPVVYVASAPLSYVEVPIAIDHISGGEVFIDRGPAQGTRVVTVGGEELLGVQEGVAAES